MELGTVSYFAFDPQTPAVRFHKMLCDGKAKARAAHFAGARHIYAVETFEDSRLVRRGNANSRVRNRDNDLAFARFCARLNLAARWGVLDRIVQEVLQNLREAPAIPGNVRKVSFKINGEFEIFFDGTRLGRFYTA